LRAIINVVGPPAAGKSFYLARLVARYPQLCHLSIDNFRISHREEGRAWYELMKAVVGHPMPLLESSGMSWRLHAHILNHPTVRKRGRVDLFLSGDRETLHHRLTERHRKQLKETMPFEYELDEHSSIDYCLEELDKLYPKARKIYTDRRDIDEVYRDIRDYILMSHEG
jgi:adenylate kinase family enzyme